MRSPVNFQDRSSSTGLRTEWPSYPGPLFCQRLDQVVTSGPRDATIKTMFQACLLEH